MMPLRIFSSRAFWVVTRMPSATGVVQEDGVPRMPSTSTRHIRQEPQGSTISVAQSFGIGRSITEAACITELPSGTLTSTPSIQSVTGAPSPAAVP